jgi:hypothetical protein
MLTGPGFCGAAVGWVVTEPPDTSAGFDASCGAGALSQAPAPVIVTRRRRAATGPRIV